MGGDRITSCQLIRSRKCSSWHKTAQITARWDRFSWIKLFYFCYWYRNRAIYLLCTTYSCLRHCRFWETWLYMTETTATALNMGNMQVCWGIDQIKSKHCNWLAPKGRRPTARKSKMTQKPWRNLCGVEFSSCSAKISRVTNPYLVSDSCSNCWSTNRWARCSFSI